MDKYGLISTGFQSFPACFDTRVAALFVRVFLEFMVTHTLGLSKQKPKKKNQKKKNRKIREIHLNSVLVAE
jgi:hypothetical protein